MVFVPINDNESPDSAGGSHWSLLVWDKARSHFISFDSMLGHNLAAAKKTALAFSASLKATVPINFIEYEKSAQQKNSYDCGMFLLNNAQHGKLHDSVGVEFEINF